MRTSPWIVAFGLRGNFFGRKGLKQLLEVVKECPQVDRYLNHEQVNLKDSTCRSSSDLLMSLHEKALRQSTKT